jgi:addiction module HigA family antidote
LIKQLAIPLSNQKTVAKWLVTGGIMRKRKPTHPGAILREDALPQLNMSVRAFSRSLGVSRQTLHAVLAERSGISPEMALRLGTLLGNGAQLWADMQTKFDLWQAEAKLHDVLQRMQRIPADHAAA